MKETITITKDKYIDASAEAAMKFLNRNTDDPLAVNVKKTLNVFAAISTLIYLELFSEDEKEDDTDKVFND